MYFLNYVYHIMSDLFNQSRPFNLDLVPFTINQETEDSLTNQPKDIIVSIGSYLTNNEDLRTITLINKKFYNIFRQTYFLTLLKSGKGFKNLSINETLCLAQRLKAKHINLSKKILKDGNKTNRIFTGFFLKSLPIMDENMKTLTELQSIKLRSWILPDKALKVLLDQCPNLQSINLEGDQFVDSLIPILAEKYLNLQSINLSFSNVTDTGIITLVEKCSRLQSINLSYCNVTNVAIEALINKCSHLQSIGLDYCNQIQISPDIINLLATKCLHLQSINIGGCEIIGDEIIKVLAEKCLHLRQIDVTLLGISDETIKTLKDRYPNLQLINPNMYIKLLGQIHNY